MIREAEVVDVDALAALECECFGAAAWSQQLVREEITSPHRTILVSESAGIVLAYGAISVGAAVSDLDRIAVVPSARRRGLARELLIALIGRARDQGAVRILLEVAAANDEAIALYATFGFTTLSTRTNYYLGGGDALVMQLDIEIDADRA